MTDPYKIALNKLASKEAWVLEIKRLEAVLREARENLSNAEQELEAAKDHLLGTLGDPVTDSNYRRGIE